MHVRHGVIYGALILGIWDQRPLVSLDGEVASPEEDSLDFMEMTLDERPPLGRGFQQ